jgi:DNA polymerase-4
MSAQRTIVHLDADAFYASVEQATDPRLRGAIMAVGGQTRGIIASASYGARRLGVYTPMPTARAKNICPQLILVRGNFEKYELFSRWMFSYLQDLTPEVEATGIDEGYSTSRTRASRCWRSCRRFGRRSSDSSRSRSALASAATAL